MNGVLILPGGKRIPLAKILSYGLGECGGKPRVAIDQEWCDRYRLSDIPVEREDQAEFILDELDRAFADGGGVVDSRKLLAQLEEMPGSYRSKNLADMAET